MGGPIRKKELAMDYKEMTKEQLLQRIEELERLNRELIFEKHQETKLEYAWTGNLGQWYWDMMGRKFRSM